MKKNPLALAIVKSMKKKTILNRLHNKGKIEICLDLANVVASDVLFFLKKRLC